MEKIMVDKVLIIHWKKLVERRKYIENVFSECVWIDSLDRDIIDDDLINNYYDYDNPELWYHRTKGLYKDFINFRNLKKSEICNSISHILALDYIIENEINLSLILEDDVRLFENFYLAFNDNLNRTPKDFDLIFIGSGHYKELLDNQGCENDKSPIKLVSHDIYEKIRNPKTRTVDAYIIKNSAAKKLRKIIDKISLPYDFDLSYFIKMLNLKVYWWDPGLVYQGSMGGNYNSSIR